MGGDGDGAGLTASPFNWDSINEHSVRSVSFSGS